MAFSPTAEQHDIASFLPCPGELVLINASAGGGKTETLRLIASSYPGTKFLHLCYNKAAAEKASQRFTANTTCKTIHSLA